MTEQLCSLQQFAELTSLSYSAAWRIVHSGELEPVYKLRGKIRIPRSAIDTWVAGQTISPQNPTPDLTPRPRRRPRREPQPGTLRRKLIEIRGEATS